MKSTRLPALAFANETTPSELQGLQYAEAMDQLRAVEPKRITKLKKGFYLTRSG